MELPQLGQQCSEPNCQQLDFLPLLCQCKKVFCSLHFKIHVETCPQVQAENYVKKQKITGLYMCSQSGCERTSVVPLICEQCKQHFCISHRHIAGRCSPSDPDLLELARMKQRAPIREFNKAKEIVDKQIEETISKAKKNAKSAEMACKLQLMRIKNKALGTNTIPVPERVYFNVQYAKNDTFAVSPVFVSKAWTLGRVIDVLSLQLNLPNNNAQLGAPKLRIFKESDCKIISQNMSAKVHDLLQAKKLVNGESLILKHVSEGCIEINWS